jgi:hypothetical protein
MATIEQTQERINKIHEEYISKVIEVANNCDSNIFLQPLKSRPSFYILNNIDPKDQPFFIRVLDKADMAEMPNNAHPL